MQAQQLLKDSLVWDAHSCAPLHPDYNLTHLKKHKDAGAHFVSVNVGMDMNPTSQVMQVIASFRQQIKDHPELFIQADGVDSVDRAKDEGKLAIGFDLEGAVPLEGRPEMVNLYYQLGVRQIHLAYNRNNEIACGCYDEDGPLTELGRDVVREIYQAGMLMDCSHTGHRSSLDIMEMGLGPVFFSHANPRSVRQDNRNLTETQIKACIQTGGIVCINGVGRFLSDPAATTASLVEAIETTAEITGIDKVGLGIDYEYPDFGLEQLPAGTDRGYWWPAAHGYGKGGVSGIKIARPEQLIELTTELLARGHSPSDISGILGGNMRALAAKVWKPQG